MYMVIHRTVYKDFFETFHSKEKAIAHFHEIAIYINNTSESVELIEYKTLEKTK